jgi:hypothetical protein
MSGAPYAGRVRILSSGRDRGRTVGNQPRHA